MDSKRVVLVVAILEDLGVDEVVQQLRLRAADEDLQVMRVDPNDVGDLTMLSARIADGEVWFELTMQDVTVDSRDIVAVLWRPPVTSPEDPGGPDGQVQLEALLRACEGILWIGGPDDRYRAQSPAVQLVAAAKAGFPTLPVAIDCDPYGLSRFSSQFKSGVRLMSWGEPHMIGTGGTMGDHMAQTRSFVMQKHVEFVHRVRIVNIDGILFAAELPLPRPVAPPWERGRNVPSRRPMRPIAVIPPGAQSAVQHFAAQLGLTYVVVDLRADTDGLWWFEGADPAGDFWPLEHDTGQPVSRFLADLLADHRRVVTP
ncbi:hypothetical protein ACFYZ9_33275 [Streptomyces sp. NPDC001691]|uniref:hypothetical protein n=1 Tax=Streptomyces sp. NPDC001691 TaxID=3364600 RepID=UPI0036AA3CB1